MDIEKENQELRRQLKELKKLVNSLFPGVGMITQRKAKVLFGETWLFEKVRDSEKCGIRLWVRTGGAPNSPKKYQTERLAEIMEWERENGLPYDFRTEKKGGAR